MDDEQGLRVLARLILSVPLEEVKSTSAVLLKNLIRLWANEIKKRHDYFKIYILIIYCFFFLGKSGSLFSMSI